MANLLFVLKNISFLIANLGNIVFIERYIFFALLMLSLYNASKKLFFLIIERRIKMVDTIAIISLIAGAVFLGTLF